MYYVYILHSKKDGKLYTGYTLDLKRRLKTHDDGFVKATKYRLPLKLIHYEAFLQVEDAKNRELYLKGGNGKKEVVILLRKYFEKNKWKR